jgi:RHH-type rel operon transcriptional repressor/antitoxin RelB
MLAVNLDPGLEARLDEISNKTGRSKDSYIEQAVGILLEDIADSLAADEVESRNEPTYRLQEVRRELGLDD